LEEKQIHQDLGYSYWRRNGKEINCRRNRKIKKKTHVLFWATVFFFWFRCFACGQIQNFKYDQQVLYMHALEDVNEGVHSL